MERGEAPALPILGENDDLVLVERSERLRELVLGLAEQARHSLDLVCRSLDARLYDTDAFSAAVKRLAIGNTRHAEVRLLVLDPAQLVARGHRLIALGQRLTSTLAIRVPAPEHRDFNEAWLVADATGYAYRRFSDRYDAEVNFNGRRRAKALTHRFEELWQRAQPEPNFRRLHL